MLRIFFLVFSQLTVSGLALMRLVPEAEIGPGFFRTCASIYLLIWVASSPALNGLGHGSSWGCAIYPAFPGVLCELMVRKAGQSFAAS